jgi:Protein of unknown function (DUF2933)
MKQDKKFLYLGGLGALAVILVMAGLPPVTLLLLACPVSMMFMMHGMGHGSSHPSGHSVTEHDKEK